LLLADVARHGREEERRRRELAIQEHNGLWTSYPDDPLAQPPAQWRDPEQTVALQQRYNAETLRGFLETQRGETHETSRRTCVPCSLSCRLALFRSPPTSPLPPCSISGLV
jgi:hypothetical protein